MTMTKARKPRNHVVLAGVVAPKRSAGRHADRRDDAWDREAERLTAEALGTNRGRINPDATSVLVHRGGVMPMPETPEQLKPVSKLWIAIISHSEVPGDHIILMCQATEPTDTEVGEEIVRHGHSREDIDSISVTHCFDMEHWLKHYDNRATLARWIAEGGMS